MKKNRELAQIFYDMADILEMKGIEWKPQAFRKAARSIDNLSKDIKQVAKKDHLRDIPGVGERLADKIKEYLKTGKIKEYGQLKKGIPKHFAELMKVPGLGPKRIKQLHDELKITTIKDLKRAAKSGDISRLKSFDVKAEKNILESIKFSKKGLKKKPLSVMLPIANKIKRKLQKVRGVKKVDIAGSVRRKVKFVGDIDILVCGDKRVIDVFVKMGKKILAKGSTKASIILKNNIQVDLRVIPEESYGAALMYFIGSKSYNIKLRRIAIKKGFKLSEYGLFKGRMIMIAGKTEKEVYKILGEKWIKPEERTG